MKDSHKQLALTIISHTWSNQWTSNLSAN